MERIDAAQVAQLDNDAGLLHEANRTFFHPLGMEIAVEGDQVVIYRGQPEETVIQVLDGAKMMAHRKFRNEVHTSRMKVHKFLIQTVSMDPQPDKEHQTRAGTAK
jgi:hypothetical protein